MLIFGLVAGGSMFLFRWMDGYEMVKKENEEINFLQYVRSDIEQIFTGLRELPGIVKDAKVGADNIKIAYVNRLAQVLDLYADEQGKGYPLDVSELVGSYIDEKSDPSKMKGLTYQRIFSGYELSIILDSGEVFTIKR